MLNKLKTLVEDLNMRRKKVPPEPQHVSLKQAADSLAVSETQILRFVKNGELKAINISLSGRMQKLSLRISQESIREFIERRTCQPEQIKGIE